jgi:hypothetical protein
MHLYYVDTFLLLVRRECGQGSMINPINMSNQYYGLTSICTHWAADHQLHSFLKWPESGITETRLGRKESLFGPRLGPGTRLQIATQPVENSSPLEKELATCTESKGESFIIGVKRYYMLLQGTGSPPYSRCHIGPRGHTACISVRVSCDSSISQWPMTEYRATGKLYPLYGPGLPMLKLTQNFRRGWRELILGIFLGCTPSKLFLMKIVRTLYSTNQTLVHGRLK